MDPTIIEIIEEKDIVVCRQECRNQARLLGFSLVDQTRITTAASELARNIYEYAKKGEVRIEKIQSSNGIGLKMSFIDHGKGIENVDLVMKDGWSSHQGMGMGLPGSKRLMDEFSIQSEIGKGTTVVAVKWLHKVLI